MKKFTYPQPKQHRYQPYIFLLILLLCLVPAFAETKTSKVDTGTKDSTYSYFKDIVTDFFSSSLETYGRISTVRITSIVAIPTKHEVLITWNASNLARGKIYYGTSTPVDTNPEATWAAASEFANYGNSKGNIRNLQASTTYYFRVFLEDESGNTTISEEVRFTTKYSATLPK